ncbi:MAG: hypothetical protein ACK5Z0_00620 [Planctomycetota bacterium]|jgi:hypothetical protein
MGKLLNESGAVSEANTDRLESLLGRLERLEQRLGPMLDQLEQAPGMLAMLGDMFDDYARRAAKEGISLEESGINLVQLSLKLGKELGPQQAANLIQLLRVAAGNPQLVQVLSKLSEAAAPAATGASASTNPPSGKLGVFGLLRAIKEPAIQQSLQWGLGVARRFNGGK